MFIATIKGRNFRDIHSGCPKVLVTQITHKGELFRDHSWIEITKELENSLPYDNHRTVHISFEGDLRGYKNHSTGEMKTTITNIKNIRRIRDR
jgi:hypothetical protein